MSKAHTTSLERPRHVFGLSITEEIEWATVLVFKGNFSEDYRSGRFDIPSGNLPHPEPHSNVEIEREIRKNLVDLKNRKPDLFEHIEGIGVSTIGIVDRAKLVLDSITRKNWGKKNSSHIIDFAALFLNPLPDGQTLFPRITDKKQIVVQNDASARCKTEYLYGGHKGKRSRPSSLMYLMAGEGINGAVAYRGDLLKMLRHSEMGHCTPQLHADDLNFDRTFSGCPAHGVCFEGLVSVGRLRMQWPQEREWSPRHPAWNRTAFYLAQMAMVGVTALNPEIIRFGGALLNKKAGLELIGAIRTQFLKLNNDYLPDYKSQAAVSRLLDRARFGNDMKLLAALSMASLAAFPEDQDKSLDEKTDDTDTVTNALMDILRNKTGDN